MPESAKQPLEIKNYVIPEEQRTQLRTQTVRSPDVNIPENNAPEPDRARQLLKAQSQQQPRIKVQYMSNKNLILDQNMTTDVWDFPI